MRYPGISISKSVSDMLVDFTRHMVHDAWSTCCMVHCVWCMVHYMLKVVCIGIEHRVCLVPAMRASLLAALTFCNLL